MTGGVLRAGRDTLPLSEAGEMVPLDEKQAALLRGPRADPAAHLLLRPYVKRAVYVAVADPADGRALLADLDQAPGAARGRNRAPRRRREAAAMTDGDGSRRSQAGRASAGDAGSRSSPWDDDAALRDGGEEATDE